MGFTVDAITDSNLIGVVGINVKNSKVIPATGLGVQAFIELIIKETANQKMNVLRIWSHGHIGENVPGDVIFGNETISATTIDTFKPLLLKLTPCFAKPSRVELRGCAPAKLTGKVMMGKLAQIWNTEVYGAEKSQFTMNWNPPVFKATPDGRVQGATGIEYNEGR